MRAVTVLPALWLAGCGDIQKLLALKDTLDDYTSGDVASVSVLGVAPPDDDRVAVALGQTDLASGARAAAWWVRSEGTGGGDAEAPAGRAVTLLVDGEALEMEEVAAGEYSADGEAGLEYRPRTEAALRINGPDGRMGLAVGLPDVPSFALPDTHMPKEPLEIDLTGQDFDASLAMVLDVLTGEVTWEQRPAGAMELYEFARAGAGVGALQIPADAFPEESIYAVGIAGTWSADPETFEGVNVALTTGFAGRFRFVTTCTFTDPGLCAAEPELPTD